MKCPCWFWTKSKHFESSLLGCKSFTCNRWIASRSSCPLSCIYAEAKSSLFIWIVIKLSWGVSCHQMKAAISPINQNLYPSCTCLSWDHLQWLTPSQSHGERFPAFLEPSFDDQVHHDMQTDDHTHQKGKHEPHLGLIPPCIPIKEKAIYLTFDHCLLLLRTSEARARESLALSLACAVICAYLLAYTRLEAKLLRSSRWPRYKGVWAYGKLCYDLSTWGDPPPSEVRAICYSYSLKQAEP